MGEVPPPGLAPATTPAARIGSYGEGPFFPKAGSINGIRGGDHSGSQSQTFMVGVDSLKEDVLCLLCLLGLVPV